MTSPVRFAVSSLVLLLASCTGAPDDLMDSPLEVGQQRQSVYSPPITATCTKTWGTVEVTVQHDGEYSAYSKNPCALFDDNFATFALITYTGMNPLKVDMKFLDGKKRLSGFRTQTGGMDDRPADYWVTMTATCDEGGFAAFPKYFLYSGQSSFLSLDAPCTTSAISFTLNRSSGDGTEHITELAPEFVDATPPNTGDRYALLAQLYLSGVMSCTGTVKLEAGDILATATGAAVGRIQLWHAECWMPGATTPVSLYYARSTSSVGTPANMQFMSTFMRYTDSYGGYRVPKTILTLKDPANGEVTSNIFVPAPNGTALTVSACTRFYADNTALTSNATASGCTAPFTLP